jgi:hypothetical protein
MGHPNPTVFVNFSSEEWQHQLECGIDHAQFSMSTLNFQSNSSAIDSRHQQKGSESKVGLPSGNLT